MKVNKNSEYPDVVKPYINDINDSYIADYNLNCFNILHIYPRELAYPDGFYYARFFDCVIYNVKENKKNVLSRKEMIYMDKNVNIKNTYVYADGSTVIVFQDMANIINQSSSDLEITRFS